MYKLRLFDFFRIINYIIIWLIDYELQYNVCQIIFLYTQNIQKLLTITYIKKESSVDIDHVHAAQQQQKKKKIVKEVKK